MAPTLSKNTHLTGFAQIGALRLNCDRTFISLLTTSTQFIIAEATRSISLCKSDRHSSAQDALFLGVQALHKSYGVCPNTISVFTDGIGDKAVDTPNVVANTSRYVIRDFRDIKEYQNKPYVVGFPHMVSYAEVPMKSSNGRVVGSYCVVDSKVRNDFFDDETIFVLSEMAASVMDYLELVTSRHAHDRGERLMEGLSLFADGRSAFRSGSMSQEGHMSEYGEESLSPSSPRPALARQHSIWTRSTVAESESSTEQVIPLEHRSPLTTPSDGPTFDAACTKAAIDEMSTVKDYPEATFISEYGTTFSRAANLIREAMEIEGLVFLDASLHGIDENASQNISRRSSVTPGIPLVSPKDDCYSDTLINDLEDPPQTRDQSPICQILGSSVVSGNTDSMRNRLRSPLVFHETSLRYLAKHYPHGNIFSVDEYGILSPRTTEDDQSRSGEDRRPGQPSVMSELPLELQRLFSTARSIIFLPLWDFSKERFFAGVLGWTTDPTRLFEQEDFTCLSAFGDSVMTELARLEAVDVSHKKSDFISSVSHELRSPLHGILASAELLRDVVIDAPQRELVRMIDSCGTTLLDTMNHLLDFSRINNFDHSKGHARKASTSGNQNQDNYGRVSVENLSDLVQDVVEGVYFGKTSKDDAHRSFGSRDNLLERESSSSSLIGVSGNDRTTKQPNDIEDKHVAVLLDLEDRSDWRMSLRVGAWKRIVMNLFANALKYTHCGHIEVSLKRLTAKDRSDSGTDYASLVVNDTGIGMSRDYQRHHLFKPFMQESSLAEGTGLGLSIVKQIVSSLSGTINVQSNIGEGTRIEVIIPLSSHQLTDVDTATKQKPDPFEELRGRSLCLVSLSCFPKLEDVPSGVMNVGDQRRTTIRTLVTKLVTEQFGMTVSSIQKLDEAEADLYLAETSFIANIAGLSKEDPDRLAARKIVTIGPHSARWATSIATSGQALTHVDYPLGPKTLSKALLAALRTSKKDVNLATRPKPDAPHEPQSQSHSSREHNQSTMLVRAGNANPKVTEDSKPTDTTSAKHLLLVDDNAINLKVSSPQQLHSHLMITNQFLPPLDSEKLYQETWLHIRRSFERGRSCSPLQRSHSRLKTFRYSVYG